MSPIKISRKNKPYFNRNIEDENKIHRAVCFSPSKKRLFDEAHTSEAGISIIDERVGSDGTTLFINDSTKVKEEKTRLLTEHWNIN